MSSKLFIILGKDMSDEADADMSKAVYILRPPDIDRQIVRSENLVRPRYDC